MRLSLSDRALLAVVRRRLARFRKPGDGGDRLADALVQLISGEVERRNRLYEGWDAEARKKRAREAEAEMRQVAFQSFERMSGEEYRQ